VFLIFLLLFFVDKLSPKKQDNIGMQMLHFEATSITEGGK
jgi:hypothetical protein